jgi:hypothetical protein
MSYVYITINEPRYKTRYRVGFFKPNGTFVTEHESLNKQAAAARTSWLNGGSYCDAIRLDQEEDL